MKAKLQKQIMLAEIINALDTLPLADAREQLYQSKDAVLLISGTVLKVARRDGLKLHLQINTELLKRKMEAHAVFNNEREIERVKDLKIKKGSSVSITGKFQTCGKSAVNLTGCVLSPNTQIPTVSTTPVSKIKKKSGSSALVIDNDVHLKRPL